MISLFSFLGAEVTDRRHARQNHFLALARTLEVAEGIVARRRLRQARQKGRFRQTKLQGGFAKKNLGRLLNPVGAHPEGDLVDIGLQNLAFTIARFDLQGHGEFAELAQVGALKRKEKILG